MAKYKATGSGFKIFVLILLVIALVFSGILWFDYLGFLNVKGLFGNVFRFLGINTPAPIEDVDNQYMLERERLKKQIEELEIRTEELDIREGDINIKEAELVQIVETIEEREKALQDKEKSFNERLEEYENRNTNLKQSSQYLVGMPPDKAVKILIEMNDQDVIDLLRITEQVAKETGEDSIVSYWLSLMSPEKASELKRKMLKKPEN